MIGIVDYGLGNISAFANAYKRLNIEARVCSGPADLEGVTRILLPGVGAFDEAMRLLNASGMRESIEALVTVEKIPVLGICVGMQIMARSSEEGTASGLGWVEAVVRKIDGNRTSGRLALPHMGWNSVEPRGASALFVGMEERPEFYFLHSYYIDCDHEDDVAAEVEYGTRFACAFRRDNVVGVQFHPEKSHRNGTLLLKNFAER